MPELHTRTDERRDCPDCGCQEFHLLRRRGPEHNREFTNLACAACGTVVGSAGLYDSRMSIECPDCESIETEPLVADFDWFCTDCGYYFDSRTMFCKGEVEVDSDD